MADPVAWMLFVDDLHLEFRNTGRIRQLVQIFLKEIAREGDLVAIRTSGPSDVMSDFASGPKLLSFATKVTGGGLHPEDSLNGARMDEVLLRARMSLSSAVAAAALLGQVELNRRALIYVSDGYGFDVNELLETRALASVVRTNGIRVFTIDAAGLDRLPPSSVASSAWQTHRTAEQNSLRIIAEQSGGLAVVDAPDVRAALERIKKGVRER